MYDVTFLGNAPVDILLPVSESFLEKHNLTKGNWYPVAKAIIDEALESVPKESIVTTPGGSSANSAYTFSHLGGKAALCAYVGDDPEGHIFAKSMAKAKVPMPGIVKEHRTLIIYALVTPDGERTFITANNSTFNTPRAFLKEQGLQEDMIKNSKWLVLEGYLFDDDFDQMLKACRIARKHQTKIVLTLAAPSFVKKHFDKISILIRDGVDLYVCNHEELAALREAELEGEDDQHAQQTFAALRETPHLVTYGPEGAKYITLKEKTHVTATPVDKVVDATGAGDAFLAGFLHGIIHNYSTEHAITQGHEVAHRVIQQIGARLKERDFPKELF